ncbi:MAG: heme lyase CcmF/NrfE family subunit [Chloroflexi bacterium]|nr:heme lyase CcmF/NrfE family subunit [Chloroflexota bacterium]
MLPTVGFAAIQISFALSIYGAVAAFWGGQKHRADLIASARMTVYLVFGLVTAAIGILLALLLMSDFSIKYVAQYTDRALPTMYKVAAVWGGNAGSLLFWLWLLSLFMCVVTVQNARRHPDLMPYVHSVMFVVAAFFASLTVIFANPFVILPVAPLDGEGLNPLLQNYWMAFHPPLLYTGYVGFTVPFAFAIGALMSRHTDARWLKATRTWTMVPWLSLTVGITLGSQWAYQELGWGGYWGWDPVENASFMPWLVGTAFLHSVIIQERRNMMKVWNMVLIILTFTLCLFGTFLTRSGVIQSVHAFANSPQSPYFLAFIALILLASFYIVARRWDLLQSEHALDSMVSREAAFIGNNLLLSSIAFATFWGTIWPVVTEVVNNTRVTVTTPFFNRVNGPIFGALVALMGLTLILGWRRTTQQSLRTGLIAPAIAALAVAVGSYMLYLFEPIGTTGFAIIAFAVVATIGEFVTSVRARHKATGENFGAALVNLFRKQRRRYGGYLVHIAFFVMCAGVVGSNVYQVEREAVLRPGDTFVLGSYGLTYNSLDSFRVANKSVVEADLTIFENGAQVGEIHPTRAFYDKGDQPITEAAIRSTLRDDLYILLAGWDGQGDSITLKVFVNPMVMWIWLGGLGMLIGTLVSMWPVGLRQPSTEVVAVRGSEVTGG